MSIQPLHYTRILTLLVSFFLATACSPTKNDGQSKTITPSPGMGSSLNRGGRIIEIEHVLGNGERTGYIISYSPRNTALSQFTTIVSDARGNVLTRTHATIAPDQMREIVAVRRAWCAAPPPTPHVDPHDATDAHYALVFDCDVHRVMHIAQRHLPPVFATLITSTTP